MSTVAVQEFLGKVNEDQGLQEEIARAMEAENDRQAVTDLAKARGYEFTSDELWTEIENRQKDALTRQESGELSDEELEAVAGGEFVVGSVIITAVSAAAVSGAATIAVKSAKW